MTTTGIILRIINAGLMIGIPVVAALMIYKRGKRGFRPIWIGALVFILSQVLHIPFNQFLMLPGLKALGVEVSAVGGISLWVLGVAAGLSAGVFEEFARFFALKYWLKKEVHTLLPLKYGVGHGGAEALLVGVLALVTLVQILALRDEGVMALIPPEQAELAKSQIQAYWAGPWYNALVPFWERITAMMFHVGASILVYKTVRSKKSIYLIIAVLGHTLLNAFAVVAVQQMDLVLMEAVIFVFAAGWLYWAWKIREIDPEEKLDLPNPEQVQIAAVQATPEQLEESRYD